MDLAEVAAGSYDATGARFEVDVLPGDLAGLRTLLAESGAPVGVDDLGPAVRAFRA